MSPELLHKDGEVDDSNKAKSVGVGYDSCKYHNCNNIKNRPLMQSDATVYVVFGITGVDRSGVSQEGHVLNQFKVSVCDSVCYVCLCVCVGVGMCVCVCVCVYERERERERDL